MQNFSSCTALELWAGSPPNGNTKGPVVALSRAAVPQSLSGPARYTGSAAKCGRRLRSGCRWHSLQRRAAHHWLNRPVALASVARFGYAKGLR